jgi:hypothetical protein
LENKRKTITKSPRNVLKKKKIEEGGTSRSWVEKKQESIRARA